MKITQDQRKFVAQVLKDKALRCWEDYIEYKTECYKKDAEVLEEMAKRIENGK